jgi:hypothetical protein
LAKPSNGHGDDLSVLPLEPNMVVLELDKRSHDGVLACVIDPLPEVKAFLSRRHVHDRWTRQGTEAQAHNRGTSHRITLNLSCIVAAVPP